MSTVGQQIWGSCVYNGENEYKLQLHPYFNHYTFTQAIYMLFCPIIIFLTFPYICKSNFQIYESDYNTREAKTSFG